MISKCSVVTVEKQLTAVVKAKVPFAAIPQAQRAARAAIDAGLPSLDTGARGLTCTRWLPPQGGALDMEMGTIVARRIEPKGEIVPSELPAGRAVHSVMTGPFDGMGAAWQRRCSNGSRLRNSSPPASTGKSTARRQPIPAGRKRTSTRCSHRISN
jgi:hypothetical protein